MKNHLNVFILGLLLYINCTVDVIRQGLIDVFLVITLFKDKDILTRDIGLIPGPLYLLSILYILNLTKSPRQRGHRRKNTKNQPKNDPLAIFSRVVKKRIGIVYSILLIKALDFL